MKTHIADIASVSYIVLAKSKEFSKITSKQKFYGKLRRTIGDIIRELYLQRDLEFRERHAMPDHIHTCTGSLPM